MNARSLGSLPAPKPPLDLSAGVGAARPACVARRRRRDALQPPAARRRALRTWGVTAALAFALGCQSSPEASSPAAETDAPTDSAAAVAVEDSAGSGEDSAGATEDSAGSGEDTAPEGFINMCGDWICADEEVGGYCPHDCEGYYHTVLEEAQEIRNCDWTHHGFIPLTDLGTGSYLGLAGGGLYPGGGDLRPPEHTAAGVDAAAAVAPIDDAICFISVGMSNTNLKWAWFMDEVAPTLKDMNPDVRLANGAVGGWPVNATADPDDIVWEYIEAQIAEDGCDPAQVQVVWFMSAMQILHEVESGALALDGDFERFVSLYEGYLRGSVLAMAEHFPNLKIVYMSSRSYAGYGEKLNDPEPYAYWGGWGVKGVIQAQIEGTDPELSLDAGAPWLSWGPYFWADGLGTDDVVGGVPGRSDGTEYECDDFEVNDGIHPSEAGREATMRQLAEFLQADATSAPWFVALDAP